MAHYPKRETTIYRRNGESATMNAWDARDACARHPDEWRRSPWPADEIAAAKKAEAEAAREAANG